MELLAVIVGLEAIKWSDAVVTVWSDSSYVVNAVENGQVFKWEQKGFLKKANPDLWIRFLTVYRKHKVRFVWIKGHAGYPDNERCDTLAVTASMVPDLAVDEVYEASNVKNELFNNPK
jgi:ribonuclease HI